MSVRRLRSALPFLDGNTFFVYAAAKGEGEPGGGAAQASWREVLGSRAAQTGVALFVFQQFAGINAIVYFSSSGGLHTPRCMEDTRPDWLLYS
jgi:hypothetical protein